MVMSDKKTLTREYVRESGKFFFRLTKEHMKVVEENLREDNKKIVALAATGVAVAAAGLVLSVLAYLK